MPTEETRPLPTEDRTAAAATAVRRRQWLRGLAASGLIAALMGCGETAASSDAVTLETTRTEFEAGRAVLIDIREPDEHATGVAPGALLLPMRQLNRRFDEIPSRPDKPVYLICNTQNRSSATLKKLRAQGYEHVRYVTGGMSEWARRGWPMVKPPGAAGAPGPAGAAGG